MTFVELIYLTNYICKVIRARRGRVTLFCHGSLSFPDSQSCFKDNFGYFLTKSHHLGIELFTLVDLSRWR